MGSNEKVKPGKNRKYRERDEETQIEIPLAK